MEKLKDDVIYRQMAIDALEKHEKTNGHNYTLFVDIVSECAEIIRDLPPAQPASYQQVTGKLDCINRQEAIDAMTNTLWHYPNECYRNLNEYEFAKGLAELGLKSVPPVQSSSSCAHENDTISRQAAIDRINKQRKSLHPDFYEQDYIGDAAYRICAEFIERLPSAQPEIIHCRDCKHADEYCHCSYTTWWNDKDDFCSRAERREDG